MVDALGHRDYSPLARGSPARTPLYGGALPIWYSMGVRPIAAETVLHHRARGSREGRRLGGEHT